MELDRVEGEGVSGEMCARVDSGCWRDTDVEGDRLCRRVVVSRIALKRERNGGQALVFGTLAGRRAPAVDVQGWNAVVPVACLVVPEQFDTQSTHDKITYSFRSSAVV